MHLSLVRRLTPKWFRPIRYFMYVTRRRTQGCVRSGPFKEMRYVNNSIGSAYVPKLLGIYERELAPEVEEICNANPQLIVDIGAAEGYYAVGLAMRNPQARIIAFETEEEGRLLVGQMARLNHVDHRVEIRGKCVPEDLRQVLADGIDSTVVCDVEGYEEYLLDLSAVPALRNATILVEMHDLLCPGITEKLQARFASTHLIRRIWQEPRTRDEFPWCTLGTTLLPGSYLDWALSEWRSERMSWLWMKPSK